jgi:hypothetical protein
MKKSLTYFAVSLLSPETELWSAPESGRGLRLKKQPAGCPGRGAIGGKQGDKRMKTVLKALSAVALLGTLAVPAFAGPDDTAPATTTDNKDLKKVIEDQGINYVETAQKGITLSGYVDTSYTYQFAGAGEYGPGGTNPGTGPANTHAALRQFDTSNNTFNVNAVKIALEKALPDKNEWAAGFRIDTIYGSDAKYLADTALNGTGGNTSGLALEQALVKFRIPIGNGLDIYAGKFVTFLGYEVIESPANLNFSRGLLFTNLIPLTHTGVYADYKFNSIVEAKLGIVDGWNNGTSSSAGNGVGAGSGVGAAFGTSDSSSFGKAITGQLIINAPGGNANITQSFIYSPQGEPGVVGQDNGSVVVYDIWGNWNPTFVKDNALLLGFNLDFGYDSASGQPGGGAGAAAGNNSIGLPIAAGTDLNDSNTWWGAALYAQYKFTKVFSLAGRLEYIHSDAALFPKFGGSSQAGYSTNAAGTAIVETPSQDDYSATLTASFNMWDNLLTRVEYRLDDLSGSSTGTGHQIDNEISLNAVYSF